MDYAYDGITGVSNPTGDYGVKQVIETTHTLKDGGGDVVIDEWSYRWDQMYNKTKRTNVRGGRNGPIYTYSYDDAYRLTHSQRQAGMTTSNTYYTLDGTNNRRLVYSVLSFPPPPDNYVLDDTAPPADEQMNQYTQTPFDDRTYDENGNLLTWTDGSTIDFEATYDYRNQMISVFDDVTDETTDYRYDALGRRIERDVDGAVTRYYYFGWRVVEEQEGDDDTVATYVYGNYIDEPLQMRRDLGSGMEDFYYHQDDMYNVCALTDESGAVVERYDYKDYGEPIVYDGNGQVISGTTYGNPYLFNGREYDPETGFHYYRTRYLDPMVGRFTTRDTIGIWGDPANLGNGYAYVGNNPWSWLDPLGLGPGIGSLKGRKTCIWDEKNDRYIVHHYDSDGQYSHSTTSVDGRECNRRDVIGGPFCSSGLGDSFTDAEKEYVKAACEEELAKMGEAVSAAAHTGLDAAGVVCEGADLANAALYALEGDNANAAISLGAVIPLAGDAGKACRRILKRGGKPVEACLDATGKVHGKLPRPADLAEYDPEDLARLHGQLTESVQRRIQKTVDKGTDFGHADRLAEEQQLIKSIEKHLEDR